jgi:hypothetical protein
LRRFVIFVVLVVTLVAVFQLSRIADNWHYIVPVEPGKLVYAASFDGVSDDWEYYEGRLSAQIENSVIRLGVAVDDDGLYSSASPYFDDFDIQVTSQLKDGVFDGNNNNGYGIVFRQKDRENYYLFLVSSDGSYRIKRVLDNTSKILSEWIFTDAIHKVPGAINRLRVVGYKDRFQFFINDEQMEVCVPENPDGISTFDLEGNCMGLMQDTLVDDAISFGRVGVAVETDRGQFDPVVVDFDNVVIFGPQPIDEPTR